MTEQTKKTAEVESSLREVQKAMTQMQLTIEKLVESKSASQNSATNMLPTPAVSNLMSHSAPAYHSQPALTSYYGNETSRGEQSPIPALPEQTLSSNYDAHGDSRGTYGNNWHSPAWTGRSAYHGRNGVEASSYAGSNPYHSGNGGPYNTGYMNGYSSYNPSPATPEQPYTYGQKPAQ